MIRILRRRPRTSPGGVGIRTTPVTQAITPATIARAAGVAHTPAVAAAITPAVAAAHTPAVAAAHTPAVAAAAAAIPVVAEAEAAAIRADRRRLRAAAVAIPEDTRYFLVIPSARFWREGSALSTLRSSLAFLRKCRSLASLEMTNHNHSPITLTITRLERWPSNSA